METNIDFEEELREVVLDHKLVSESEARDVCVYFHYRSDDLTVFYVGISSFSKKRPYETKSRSKMWKNVANKHGCIVKIAHKNLTWKEACYLEMWYIAHFGRKDLHTGELTNLTPGGDKPPSQKGNKHWVGRKHKPETIALYKSIRLGKPSGTMGRKQDKEHTAKMVITRIENRTYPTLKTNKSTFLLNLKIDDVEWKDLQLRAKVELYKNQLNLNKNVDTV